MEATRSASKKRTQKSNAQDTLRRFRHRSGSGTSRVRNVALGISRTVLLPRMANMREWVPANPPQTFSRRATKLYWRMIFLSLHNVIFRNIFDDNGKHQGCLLHTTDRKISVCIQHMLHDKGYPIKDARCKTDTCFVCYPELNRRIAR